MLLYWRSKTRKNFHRNCFRSRKKKRRRHPNQSYVCVIRDRLSIFFDAHSSSCQCSSVIAFKSSKNREKNKKMKRKQHYNLLQLRQIALYLLIMKYYCWMRKKKSKRHVIVWHDSRWCLSYIYWKISVVKNAHEQLYTKHFK